MAIFLKKELLLREVTTRWPDLIQTWQGPNNVAFDNVSGPESCNFTSFVFASTPQQLETALQRKAAVIVASAKLTLPPNLPPQTCLLKSPNVGLAMSAILPYFDSKQDRFNWSDGIHPSAFVHPTAQVAKGVQIGPFAVVGPGAQVGANTLIGAHTILEKGAKVGADCILHPLVFVGADCEIGTQCEIHPHVTIGSDGFGYAQDGQGRHHKLPQLGRVVIGDRVEIGANCAIDRAAFTETKIGSGTKLDNLCHIGHNVELGEDGVGTAGLMIAGSSKVGRGFMTGGMVAITDHVTLTDKVILAGRATVTNDVTESGAYGGYPLVPMKDHLKNLASSVHITTLRKQVARILKHLNLEGE